MTISDGMIKCIQDEYADELFHKPYDQLSIGEISTVADYMYDLNHPQWKPIIINGEKSIYEVSNTGKIFNTVRKSYVVQSITRKGYLRTSLWHSGRRKSYAPHRLVAIAFIPNPENKPQVNHINGNKQLNWVGNLEWNTQTENINHAINTGLMTPPGKGINGRNAKHDEATVHDVCKMLEKSIPISKIASSMGVTRAFVIGIKYGNNWESIRSQYNIPDSNSYVYKPKDKIEKIDAILKSGTKLTYRDILLRVGLPDTKTNRSYVKYRNKMVKRSTTIERLDDGGNTTSQQVE